MRRIFGEGDNFFAWSLPLLTAAGIRVRVHIIFVVMILARLIGSLGPGNIGFGYVAFMMAAMFVLVLLHEFGHCLACRRIGGEADEILMWPLGGLAFCRPPHNWKASLITTVGGPAVNLILVPVLGGVLLAMKLPFSVLLPDLLDPGRTIVVHSFTKHREVLAFWLYYSNLVLLLFNVLLPMFPLDGGRILQAILWRKMGYDRSTFVAANTGLFLAVIVGTYSILTSASTLTAVAIFAGFECYMTKRRLAATSLGFEPAQESWRSRPATRDDAAYQRAVKLQEQRRREQVEIDRILDKISREGMASLSRAEKKALQQDTERKRAGEAG